MPLSETNKKQSQSIEDLIAQLDAPSVEDTESNQIKANYLASVNNNGNNGVNRKVIRGKRTTSTSSSVQVPANGISPNPNGTSFVKTASFGQNSEPLLSKNIIMSKKYSKHMRTLNNRGQPKKGGAGGKHTWGAPGCELNYAYLDKNDPNYDSEEGGNVVMVCVENNGSGGDVDDNDENKVRKEIDVNELDAEIKPVILEYFQNGDTIEVIDHLKCYDLRKLKSHLVSYFIQIALEHNNTCKELMSRLLRDLTFELLNEEDFVNGFDLLLKNLSDLTLDNPDAAEKTGTFIARAIADNMITKDYMERFYDASNHDMNNEHIRQAVDSCRVLVQMNNHLFQLSHIWGNKGGFLAVKQLTDKINEIIREYYDSRDMNEAVRCLKELSVPHFHHEFVFEALDFALEKSNDDSIELITDLLATLCKAVIVTYDQLKIVSRVFFLTFKFHHMLDKRKIN
jgi:programmed cell death protein 4